MDGHADRNTGNDGKVIRRRKARGPRSRQGCRTCRIRRVKCDEQKPECTRCSSTGRWCEWFAESTSHDSSTSPQTDEDSVNSHLAVQTSKNEKILLPLPNSPFSDPDQYRSFQYFRQRTVPQLSGVFSNHFWDYVLLQATHYNDTLRYAVVALGSLHERFEKSDPTILRSNKSLVQGGYALQQYVQAIGSLVKPTDGSSTGVDIYLVSCLLFASFETLRGHHASAIKHVQSGVKILAEIAVERSSNTQPKIRVPESPLVPLEMLAVIFTRMDTQVRQLVGKSVFPAGIAKAWQFTTKCFCEEVPDTFESIEDARNSLDYAWNDICQILEDTYDRGVNIAHSYGHIAAWERQRLLARCQRWSKAVTNMVAEKFTQFTPQELRAAQLMKMVATLGSVTLQSSGPTSETAFDDYIEEYRTVVDLAALVVKKDTDAKRFGTDAKSAGDRKGLPRFQMDMGIIIALFEVIWKCRDPVIRRRGIALLEDNPWQEGLWDGALVAKCGHLIVALEEGKSGRNVVNGTVPDWARVSEVDVRFDLEDRCGYVKMKQPLAGPNSTPEYTHHVIHWKETEFLRDRTVTIKEVAVEPREVQNKPLPPKTVDLAVDPGIMTTLNVYSHPVTTYVTDTGQLRLQRVDPASASRFSEATLSI